MESVLIAAVVERAESRTALDRIASYSGHGGD